MALSADLFGNIGDAADGIFTGIGQLKAADAYGKAADIATQNAALSRMSTRIQQTQAAREVFQGIGGQQSDVASAGFAQGGTALDLMRSSVQQGALQNQLLKLQGLVTENSYQQEAASFKGQQAASKASAGGSFFKTALSIASIALPFLSDETAKQDVTLVGPSHVPGVNVYLFRYRGDPAQRIYQGVLAQEVKRARPDAVTETESGLLAVDYDKLGIAFKEV